MVETPPDAVLLRRSGGGDAGAFELFLHRHRDAVWRYLVTLTGDAADADDAFQETFVAAWRGSAGFHGENGARAWLLTIARHVVTRSRRRHAGEPATFESVDELADAAGWGDAEAPDLRVERREARETLRRALDRLDPADREVILLRDLEDIDGDEAAAMLGITSPALKSRLHRARLRLVAAVRKEVSDALPGS